MPGRGVGWLTSHYFRILSCCSSVSVQARLRPTPLPAGPAFLPLKFAFLLVGYLGAFFVQFGCGCILPGRFPCLASAIDAPRSAAAFPSGLALYGGNACSERKHPAV